MAADMSDTDVTRCTNSDSSEEDEDSTTVEDEFIEMLTTNNAVHNCNRSNLVKLLKHAKISANFDGSTVHELQKLLWLHLNQQLAYPGWQLPLPD